MVDEAITRLTARGKLKLVRGQKPVPSGQPLKGSTINRYVTQLQSLFKFARRQRVVPRSWTPPTKGIEKSPEPMDPNKFLSVEEVDQLIKAAKVADTHWKKLPTLIRLLLDTGLRVGNAINLRWRDVDLVNRTATVAVTKNGAPHIAALSERLVMALVALPGHRHPDALIFGNKHGAPFHFRAVFRKAAKLACLPKAHPHLMPLICIYDWPARADVAAIKSLFTQAEQSLLQSRRRAGRKLIVDAARRLAREQCRPDLLKYCTGHFVRLWQGERKDKNGYTSELILQIRECLPNS